MHGTSSVRVPSVLDSRRPGRGRRARGGPPRACPCRRRRPRRWRSGRARPSGPDDGEADQVGEADLGARRPDQMLVQHRTVDLEQLGRHRSARWWRWGRRATPPCWRRCGPPPRAAVWPQVRGPRRSRPGRPGRLAGRPRRPRHSLRFFDGGVTVLTSPCLIDLRYSRGIVDPGLPVPARSADATAEGPTVAERTPSVVRPGRNVADEEFVRGLTHRGGVRAVSARTCRRRATRWGRSTPAIRPGARSSDIASRS